jgi:hypothetical protein
MSPDARSLRLTFRYDEDGLRLARRTRRAGGAPRSAPLDREPPAGALVLELRTASDKVLYRQLLSDPIPQSLEAGDGKGGFRRVDHTRKSGAFTVVVPASEEATVVVVSAGPGVELAQRALAPPPGPRRWRELTRSSLERSDGND